MRDILVGRRQFLASTAVASAGALLLPGSATAAVTAPGESVPPKSSAAGAEVSSGVLSTGLNTAVVGAAAALVRPGDSSIRPFRYRASDAELAELKRRVRNTRWPERE